MDRKHNVEPRRKKVSAVAASGLLALVLWTVLSAHALAEVSDPRSGNGSHQQENAMQIAAFTGPVTSGSGPTRVVLQDSGTQAAARRRGAHDRERPPGCPLHLVVMDPSVTPQP